VWRVGLLNQFVQERSLCATRREAISLQPQFLEPLSAGIPPSDMLVQEVKEADVRAQPTRGNESPLLLKQGELLA